MSRIASRFGARRDEGKTTFVSFVTAGDPSLDRTVEVALELEQGGTDVLELGVPFSDPVADGPVIQRSSERALSRGTTLAGVLDAARRIRDRSPLPLVIFSYLNPIHRYGLERFARDASWAGVDGVLVTDMPPEEADEWLASLADNDLDAIMLAAPTSSDERLDRIVASATGFVYAVSRTGVTGERAEISQEASELTKRVRARSDRPVALGFGISSPEQVEEAARIADGVVVGSALVRFLEEEPDGDVAKMVKRLRGAV